MRYRAVSDLGDISSDAAVVVGFIGEAEYAIRWKQSALSEGKRLRVVVRRRNVLIGIGST